MGLTDAFAGMDRHCPTCHASPGRPCRDRGRERITTHQERKEPGPTAMRGRSDQMKGPS